MEFDTNYRYTCSLGDDTSSDLLFAFTNADKGPPLVGKDILPMCCANFFFTGSPIYLQFNNFLFYTLQNGHNLTQVVCT